MQVRTATLFGGKHELCRCHLRQLCCTRGSMEHCRGQSKCRSEHQHCTEACMEHCRGEHQTKPGAAQHHARAAADAECERHSGRDGVTRGAGRRCQGRPLVAQPQAAHGSLQAQEGPRGQRPGKGPGLRRSWPTVNSGARPRRTEF